VRLRTLPSSVQALINANASKGFASNTVQGPASLVELTRALNVDNNGPQLMYEWVYNNIEWEPGWGANKGDLGTILDGMGNAFDQASLLANLLREAGETANCYAQRNSAFSEQLNSANEKNLAFRL